MNKAAIVKFYANYKLLIFPLVVALSSLILILLVILPQTIKLLINQRVGNDLLSRSENLEVKAETLASINEGELLQNLGYALNVYPQDRDLANVVGQVQIIAARTGFNIVSLNLGGGPLTPPKGGAQSFNVTLQLTGSKALLPLLLSELENAPRLMRVSSLEISSIAIAGGSGIQVSLGIDVLYSVAPPEFGTVDSPLPQLSEKEQELLVRLAKVGSQRVGTGQVISAPRGKANPFE